jgi:hypothetical protein
MASGIHVAKQAGRLVSPMSIPCTPTAAAELCCAAQGGLASDGNVIQQITAAVGRCRAELACTELGKYY